MPSFAEPRQNLLSLYSYYRKDGTLFRAASPPEARQVWSLPADEQEDYLYNKEAPYRLRG